MTKLKKTVMNIKLWSLTLVVLVVSCGNATPVLEHQEEDFISQDYQPLVENHRLIGLQWKDDPVATGYVVIYSTRDMGNINTVEITEPYIIFNDLDPEETYYITILTKSGTMVGTLRPNPIALKGGNMSSAGIVIYGIPVNEEPEPDTSSTLAGGQPFDITLFKTERAAWESQRITHYRFTRTFDTNPPYPDLTIEVAPDREPEIVPSISSDQWMAEEADGFGKTIDELYTIILERFVPNIAEDIACLIRYNTKYHYPEWFEFRVILPPGNTGAGGWFGFKVTDFRVMKELEATH